MLVDDHDVGRRSLARLLDALGYDVTSAADGASALEALEVGPGFDYLLTDVRLPDLDGREIVQVARLHEPRPLIALITGWDIDPSECDRLGIDYLFPQAGGHPGAGRQAPEEPRLKGSPGEKRAAARARG